MAKERGQTFHPQAVTDATGSMLAATNAANTAAAGANAAAAEAQAGADAVTNLSSEINTKLAQAQTAVTQAQTARTGAETAQAGARASATSAATAAQGAASGAQAAIDAAVAEALGVAGIDPAYISATEADPPDAEYEGTRGARRDADGSVVLLSWDGAAWAEAGPALLSREAVHGLLASARAEAPPAHTEVDLGVRLQPPPSPLALPLYDGGGDPVAEAVHPSVVDFGLPWNGYRYWMAVTPYPNSDASFENPSVLAAADPAGPWVAPPGGANPLVGPPAAGFFSDVELVRDGDGLALVFRSNDTPGFDGERWLLTRSLDGVTWSAPRSVLAFEAGEGGLSPAVARFGGLWHAYYVDNVASPAVMRVRRAARLEGPWTSPTTCPLALEDGSPYVGALWHGAVCRVGDRLLQVMSSQTALRLMVSDDGLAWTVAGVDLVRAVPTEAVPAWAAQLYRSSCWTTTETDGEGAPALRLHVMLGSTGLDPGRDWRVGYASTVVSPQPEAKATRSAVVAADRRAELAYALAAPGAYALAETWERAGALLDTAAPDLGQPWTQTAGAWTVASGQLVRAGSTGNALVLTEVGADVEVTGSVLATGDAPGALNDEAWLVARYASGSSFVRFGYAPGGLLRLQFVGVSGQDVELGAYPFGPLLSLACDGDAFTARVDGVEVASKTVSGFAGTRAGYQMPKPGGTAGSVTARRLVPDRTDAAPQARLPESARALQAMGVERAFRRLGGAGYVAGDGFDRADSTTVGNAEKGGAWTAGNFQVLGGRLRRNGGGDSRATLVGGERDVEVSAEVWPAVALDEVYVAARYLNDGSFVRFGFSSNQWVLQVVGGDTVTADTTLAEAQGARLTLRCVGGTVYGLVDGVEVLSVADAATSGSRVGVQVFGTNAEVDDFLAVKV